jgi:hypothetical protein
MVYNLDFFCRVISVYVRYSLDFCRSVVLQISGKGECRAVAAWRVCLLGFHGLMPSRCLFQVSAFPRVRSLVTGLEARQKYASLESEVNPWEDLDYK